MTLFKLLMTTVNEKETYQKEVLQENRIGKQLKYKWIGKRLQSPAE